MKLYLDNSFLNRPFDDPAIGVNRLETDALRFIVEQVKKGKIRLVNSSTIEYENYLNPFPERKAFVGSIGELASFYQNRTDNVEKTAARIVKEAKIAPIDALHLAAATASQVDFFITCDYTIVKRMKEHKCALKVVSPLEFIEHYEKPSSN